MQALPNDSFDVDVLRSLQILIEENEVFDEFEVHAIFDLANNALADFFLVQSMPAEVVASCILHNAAIMMSFGPGWRLYH